MNRRTAILLIALALSAAFAGWQWLRPYEWHADPGARYVIDYANLKGDHGYTWVELHLKRSGAYDHDLMKPVTLLTGTGRELEPSETTLGGEEGNGATQIFFRFWLENKDLASWLKLKLNDGTLEVRSGQGVPVASGDSRAYHSSHW
ncbi:MAG: hypothetical protein JWO82_1337 [Akkermansiaceae bacterium]|nr:hypothetical protein [Akkermansiaceae bacterium]